MSVDATRETWKLGKQISATQKLILLAIADRAGESGEAWPSLARMMLDTNLDRHTLINNRKTLIEKGLLEYTGDFKGRHNQIPIMRLTYIKNREDETDMRPNKKTESFSSSTSVEINTGDKNTSVEIPTCTSVEIPTPDQCGNPHPESTISNLKEELERGARSFSPTYVIERLRMEIHHDHHLRMIFDEKNLSQKYPSILGLFEYYRDYQETRGKDISFLQFKNWLINEKSLPKKVESNSYIPPALSKQPQGGVHYHNVQSDDQKYRSFVYQFESDKRLCINDRNEETRIPTFDEWKSTCA